MSKPALPHSFTGLDHKVHNLVSLASVVAGYVETALEDNAVHEKPFTYEFTESSINSVLYSVYELRRQIEAFSADYSAAWHAEFATWKAAREDQIVTVGDENPLAMRGPVRTAWRQAIADVIPRLSFWEMSVAYTALHSVSEALRDVCDGSLSEKPGGDFIEIIQEDLASIRSSIGKFCMTVADKSPSEDPKDQQNLCDSVALSEASFDPEGNADLIAAIGARLVKKSRKAETKRKAATATVTAKAA